MKMIKSKQKTAQKKKENHVHFTTRKRQEPRIKLVHEFKSKNLSEIEKISKLKVLSKIVRRYRRKLKNLHKKFNENCEKNFKKYISSNVFTNGFKKDKKIQQVDLPLNTLVTAIKKIQNSNSLTFSHERNIVQQLIESIAQNKLKPNSIQFKKIATFVRMCLDSKKISHISKNKPKIMISLEEKNIDITERELMYYKQGEDENILRAIFGVKKQIQFNQGNRIKMNEEYVIPRNASYVDSVNAPDEFFNTLFKMNSNIFMKN